MEALSKKQQKKARKQLSKGGGTAEQALAIYGKDARAAVELLEPGVPPATQPLALRDLQNVLLWVLTRDLGEMPRWLCVRSKPLVRGALVIIAPSLHVAPRGALLAAGFTPPRRVQLPRSHHSRTAVAAAMELLQVKLPRKRKAAAMLDDSTAAASSEADHPGRLPCGRWRLSYVRSFGLSRSELRENDYPIAGEAPGCLTLRATHDSEEAARLVAIDCEMVLVRGETKVDGGWPLVQQLARVALVDESGTTLLDELVKPEKPVEDYVTRHSGITKAILDSATMSFGQVRERVAALIAGCVLVGHSLECDLNVLRLSVPLPPKVKAVASTTSAAVAAASPASACTPLDTPPDKPTAPAPCVLPCILDTAVLFPLRVHNRGPPTKSALRNLTVTHLKREIQQSIDPAAARLGSGDAGGHDPVEDATAAMDLALLKLARGHAYATPGASWGGAYEPMRAVLHRTGWSCHVVGCEESALAALQPASSGEAPQTDAAELSGQTAPSAPPTEGAAIMDAEGTKELTHRADVPFSPSDRGLLAEAVGVACSGEQRLVVLVLDSSDAEPPSRASISQEGLLPVPVSLLTELPPNTLVVLVDANEATEDLAATGEDEEEEREEPESAHEPQDTKPGLRGRRSPTLPARVALAVSGSETRAITNA